MGDAAESNKRKRGNPSHEGAGLYCDSIEHAFSAMIETSAVKTILWQCYAAPVVGHLRSIPKNGGCPDAIHTLERLCFYAKNPRQTH